MTEKGKSKLQKTTMKKKRNGERNVEFSSTYQSLIRKGSVRNWRDDHRKRRGVGLIIDPTSAGITAVSLSAGNAQNPITWI